MSFWKKQETNKSEEIDHEFARLALEIGLEAKVKHHIDALEKIIRDYFESETFGNKLEELIEDRLIPSLRAHEEIHTKNYEAQSRHNKTLEAFADSLRDKLLEKK